MSLFALYESWGVAGVKLGFVDDGAQAMTDTVTGWVQTTNAHQMAIAAVYYQPLNFLYWYDGPSKYANAANWPGLPWFDAVPTSWDESRTLAGEIGEYVAIARRSGTTWYLGAMTNETARTLSIPLSFLGSGSSTYPATVYADGTPGSSPYATPVTVATQTVSASSTPTVAMASAGGQAVILKPLN